MRLEISPKTKKKVTPQHIVDYASFKECFGKDENDTELHLLEKFYAARSLIREGCLHTYVGALLRCVPQYKPSQPKVADVCGKIDDELTIFLCETDPPTHQIYEFLETINKAENTKAILIYPFTTNFDFPTEKFSQALKSRKFEIKTFSWLNQELEEEFERALDLIDLISNKTRIKMLLPLLQQSCGKKRYRMRINPKLIYRNIPSLLRNKLIEEKSFGKQYELTSFGRHVLCEYLAFLERVKTTLIRVEDS